jgi:hypothetical protein
MREEAIGDLSSEILQLPSVQRVNVGDIIKTNRYKYYNGYIKEKYISYQMNGPDPKYT